VLSDAEAHRTLGMPGIEEHTQTAGGMASPVRPKIRLVERHTAPLGFRCLAGDVDHDAP
jgi:hypothetical protein